MTGRGLWTEGMRNGKRRRPCGRLGEAGERQQQQAHKGFVGGDGGGGRVGRARTQQPMVGVVRDLPFLSGVLHSEGGSGFERVSELAGFNLKARG